MDGVAIPIVLSRAGHKFDLDESTLKRLLLRDDIKDRNVVVVSVAGAFRKGKSFILDFFLRYMKHRYKLGNTSLDWLGSQNEPLKGFPWKAGSERDTIGILMWSEIFTATLPSGENIAVILMDTQGTFDSESTVQEWATVFALSTMISSIQVYNLSQNIQEDDLQHLQLFTAYGRLAMTELGSKPFQKLVFLIRDWCCPYEFEYGAKGGQLFLDKRLQVSEKQHPQLQSLRKHIKSCFTNISCYLLPHPGLKVAANPQFDGSLRDINPEFQQFVKELAPMLLAPENVVIKKINAQKIVAKELLQYFKSYLAAFSGDELPVPKTIYEATSEANNLAAVSLAKDLYTGQMDRVCGPSRPWVREERLEVEHNRVKALAVKQFSIKRKMGGQELAEKFRGQLEDELDRMYLTYSRNNDAKRGGSIFRTPLFMLTLLFLLFALSKLAQLIGLAHLAGLLYWSSIVTLVALATYMYVVINHHMSFVN